MKHAKQNWTVGWAVIALFAVYFPVAIWLKYSYEPPKMLPGAVLQLINFQQFAHPGSAFLSLADKHRSVSDSLDYPDRSPMIVYEDDTPLGPAHSLHDDIAKTGLGRFSHWDRIVVFSTSDNSDPRTNGRRYWLVQPPETK